MTTLWTVPGVIFPGYVPLAMASQSPYPIMYSLLCGHIIDPILVTCGKK